MDRFLYCTHVPFKLFTGYSYCMNKLDLNAMNACFVQSMTSLQLLSRPNRTASTSWRESLLCTTRPSTHTMQDSEDMSITFVCMQDILQCVCVCVCVLYCVQAFCTTVQLRMWKLQLCSNDALYIMHMPPVILTNSISVYYIL